LLRECSDGGQIVNLLREVNDRIRERADRLGEVGSSRFVCECGDPDCRRTVMLTLSAYDTRRNTGASSRILAHEPH
jgi:hypothetical protein